MDGGCGCDGGAPSVGATGGAETTAKSVVKAAYSGTATFGKVMSTIGAVIGCIIAIILVLIGITQLRSSRTTSSTATVTKVVSTTPNVVVNATFTNAKGGATVTISNVNLGSNKGMVVGSTFTVWYDSSDPQHFSTGVSPGKLGWGLIIGGIVVAVLVIGVSVLAHKYKWFAALYGADQGISMIRSIV